MRVFGLGGRAATLALALLIGLAITLGPARVSADEYIDNVESFQWILEGQRTALGSPDGVYVEVGYIPEDDPYALPSSITLAFQDNVAFDGPGPDLRVYTVAEQPRGVARIEVSQDGTNYLSAGQFFDDAGDIEIDIASLGLASATHLRVRYVSGPFGAYVGFNLDAVEALHSFEIPAIALTLDPPTDSTPGFEAHTVLTTVTDGAPVAAINVSFAVVAGPNTGLSGTVRAGRFGGAIFTWSGNGIEGIDTLEAWLDLDADGTRDAGEPFGTATKLWRNGITGTIAISDLGGSIEVVVNDLDLDTTDGADSVTVAVVSDTDPAGITLTLTETDIHSGILAGTFSIGASSNELSALLAAVEGDTITASYDDVIDVNNQDPPPVTATLIVAPAAEAHVTVCHLPPGNPGNQRTLTLGASALAAHLAHGDTEGECAPSEIATKRDQAPHGPPEGAGGPPEGSGDPPVGAGGPPEGKGKPPK